MSTERTSKEWGRLAVSLPGWRWMPGMRSEINTDTRRAAYRWLAGPSDDRHYGHVVIVEDKHGHACRTLATLQPGPDDLPDLTDPATLGCVLALARETADDPGLYARCMLPYAPDMSGKTPPPWVLYSGRGARLTDRFNTEKEALLWALRWPKLADWIDQKGEE